MRLCRGIIGGMFFRIAAGVHVGAQLIFLDMFSVIM